MHGLIIAQAAVTLVIVGMILTIQQVHYPLFAKVGVANFAAYEAAHKARITALVMPLMTLELAIASALALFTPAEIPRWSAFAGLALVLAIWFSTFFVQAQKHAILARGWDVHAHASLVASNWIRTSIWISRGALTVWWLFSIGT